MCLMHLRIRFGGAFGGTSCCGKCKVYDGRYGHIHNRNQAFTFCAVWYCAGYEGYWHCVCHVRRLAF